MCYSLRRTWRHLQVGAMVAGTVCAHVEEEAGRWGVKRLEGAARSNRHSTPIHVTVLCHFLDLLQGVTFLSFWLAYQTLKSLIMILSVQLWFQTPPQSSWSQQAVTRLLWVGYCNSPPHEVLMISRFFAQFLTRVQLSKFYLSAGYLNQMKIFSLQNKETF